MNQLSDKFLLQIISQGGRLWEVPFMPGWGSKLKEKQVREIISYIRSLAAPRYGQPGK